LNRWWWTLNKILKSKAGITLLELLIAFGILALIMIPALRSFLTTSKAVKKRGDYTTAIYLCQKIIEDIRWDIYNEDSIDFSRFLSKAREQGKTIVPGTECSKYFQKTLDPENEVDQAIIRQMGKFTIEIDYGSYFVPLAGSEAESAEGATIDVDGDGIKDPDAALITVIIKWKEKMPSETEEDNEEDTREVKFSTVLSKTQNEQREEFSGGT